MNEPDCRLRVVPDFAEFTYTVARRPATTTFDAWDKLEECERRLEMCRWVREGVTLDPGPNYRPLVEDFASAFILTFGAAFTFLVSDWERHGQGSFWTWVAGEQSYSVVIKGLRAIRILESHVAVQESRGRTIVYLDGRPTERDFWLPELTVAKLESITRRYAPMTAAELPAWHARSSERELTEVFEEGLCDLVALTRSAEAECEGGSSAHAAGPGSSR